MKIPSHPTPRTPRHVPAVALLLSIAVFFTGCTTMRTTSLPAQPGSAVHVGDNVVVHTKAGHTHIFQVATIEPAAFTGKNGTRVEFAEISQLKVQRVNVLLTARELLGATVGVILVLSLLGAPLFLAGP
jgi:hypothetical protein